MQNVMYSTAPNNGHNPHDCGCICGFRPSCLPPNLALGLSCKLPFWACVSLASGERREWLDVYMGSQLDSEVAGKINSESLVKKVLRLQITGHLPPTIL